MKLKVEYLPIDEIKPYENNAKIHTPEQIEQIKASIQQFGMNDPIGIWSKENIIVEGHGRLLACQELGYKEIPVIRLDDLTDEQRKAYTLAHNQLTMNTGFDLDILNQEPADISIDMQEFGFEDINKDDFNIEEDDFEFNEEEIPEAKAKRGEIYKLGEHILMCGDSTARQDVEKLLNGKIADLVVTDPPYNVAISNSQGMTIENDDMSDESFRKFLNSAFENMSDSLKEGGAFYVWYASREHINFESALLNNNLTVRQQLIWVKNSLVLGRQDYQWRHEPCLYGWKDGEGHYFIYDRTQSTVMEQKEIDIDKLSPEESKKLLKKIYSEIPSTIIKENKPQKNNLHPTMKPIELIGRLIHNSSEKGQIVLDLFGGSGSTLIACEQLGRKCYMMEYDPIYVDAIIQRYEEFTGKKAELISKGD